MYIAHRLAKKEAPVVQRIEQIRPKDKMGVQFPPGALTVCMDGNYPVYFISILTFLGQRALSAVGSAFPWHGRGHRFEPGRVH